MATWTKHDIEGNIVCPKTGKKLTHVWWDKSTNGVYDRKSYKGYRMFRVTRDGNGITSNISLQKVIWRELVSFRVKRKDKSYKVTIPVAKSRADLLKQKQEQAYVYTYTQREDGIIVQGTEGYTSKYTKSAANVNTSLKKYTEALGLENNEIHFADGKAEIIGVYKTWNCQYINFVGGSEPETYKPIYHRKKEGLELPYLCNLDVYQGMTFNPHGSNYTPREVNDLSHFEFSKDGEEEQFDYIELEVLA